MSEELTAEEWRGQAWRRMSDFPLRGAIETALSSAMHSADKQTAGSRRYRLKAPDGRIVAVFGDDLESMIQADRIETRFLDFDPADSDQKNHALSQKPAGPGWFQSFVGDSPNPGMRRVTWQRHRE